MAAFFPTKRALDWQDSARFTSTFSALRHFPSPPANHERTPLFFNTLIHFPTLENSPQEQER